jgi:hypothetical protein
MSAFGEECRWDCGIDGGLLSSSIGRIDRRYCGTVGGPLDDSIWECMQARLRSR